MAEKQNWVRAKHDQNFSEENNGLDLELPAKKWVPISKEEVKILKAKYSYLEFKEE